MPCIALVISVAYWCKTYSDREAKFGWAIFPYAVPQQGAWPCPKQAHVRPLTIFACMTHNMRGVSPPPGMGNLLHLAKCGAKAPFEKQPQGAKAEPMRKRCAQGKSIKAGTAPSEQVSRKRKAKELGTKPQRVTKKVWCAQHHSFTLSPARLHTSASIMPGTQVELDSLVSMPMVLATPHPHCSTTV